MLAKGALMEEVLYGFGAGARFGPDDVPPILVTALPHLTRDYEALYDEMGPFLRSGGRAPLGQHYRYLFDWLCRRFDRERVVERSGSSLLFVSALARHFEGRESSSISIATGREPRLDAAAYILSPDRTVRRLVRARRASIRIGRHSCSARPASIR